MNDPPKGFIHYVMEKSSVRYKDGKTAAIDASRSLCLYSDCGMLNYLCQKGASRLKERITLCGSFSIAAH